MQPQGSSILNAAFFAALTVQAQEIKTCAELQSMATTVMASIQAEKNAIEAQIAALTPILALLTAPTSPTAAVTWITSFITGVLTPQYKPYITYATQLTELASSISSLTSAIESAAALIPSCSVTVPPLT
jgi:hypothetical protein